MPFTAIASVALAQTPTVIPYSGIIEVIDDETGERVLVDGPQQMRFTLYDASGGYLWRENRSARGARDCPAIDDCSVEVHNGRFTVALGEYEAITNDILLADGLQVGIGIVAAGAWADFPTLQQIGVVPYAASAEHATDLYVDGAIDTGSTTVGGDLELTNVDVDGDAEFGGELASSSVASGADSTATGTVEVDGEVATATTLSVTGSSLTLPIGGTDTIVATLFDAGSQIISFADSGDVYLTDNNGVVTIEGDVRAIGSVGLYMYNTDLEFRDFTWEAGDELIRTHYLDFGTSTSTTLDVDPDEWVCTIGGLDFGTGDLQDSSSNRILSAYLIPNDDTYTVFADMSSHNGDHEEHRVGVVCFDANMTDIGADFGWWD